MIGKNNLSFIYYLFKMYRRIKTNKEKETNNKYVFINKINILFIYKNGIGSLLNITIYLLLNIVCFSNRLIVQ